MTKQRTITALTTDDPDEAFKELRRRRETGEWGWDMADVRHMTDPPRTVHRWYVFRRVVSEEAA
jgi:hypothetical protein